LRYRGLMPALGRRHDAEIMIGAGMAGRNRQCTTIHRLRFAEPAGLMMRERFRHKRFEFVVVRAHHQDCRIRSAPISFGGAID
jgi:hypothetical protein